MKISPWSATKIKDPVQHPQEEQKHVESQTQQYDLSAQRRLRSARAYTRPDQFSLSAQWEAKDPRVF